MGVGGEGEGGAAGEDAEALADGLRSAVRREGLESVLDAAVELAERGSVHGRVVFELVGDELDAKTISECAEAWKVVEAREDALRRLARSQDATKNAALRVCNELLKRLSVSLHAELCGRVLFFLARCLPLSLIHI